MKNPQFRENCSRHWSTGCFCLSKETYVLSLALATIFKFSTGCPKKTVNKEISITFELMILYKDYKCLGMCKHMKDTY